MRISDITPKNAYSFVEGNIRNLSPIESEPPHVQEQILNRMNKCAPCVLNGKCVSCGCNTQKMMRSYTKTCPQNKWGVIITNKEEYVRLSQQTDIPDTSSDLN